MKFDPNTGLERTPNYEIEIDNIITTVLAEDAFKKAPTDRVADEVMERIRSKSIPKSLGLQPHNDPAFESEWPVGARKWAAERYLSDHPSESKDQDWAAREYVKGRIDKLRE